MFSCLLPNNEENGSNNLELKSIEKYEGKGRTLKENLENKKNDNNIVEEKLSREKILEATLNRLEKNKENN
jgi:hypothetical protein